MTMSTLETFLHSLNSTPSDLAIRFRFPNSELLTLSGRSFSEFVFVRVGTVCVPYGQLPIQLAPEANSSIFEGKLDTS